MTTRKDRNGLAAIRAQRGITLKKLAEMTGFPLSTIGNFARGRFDLSLEKLVKIASVLDVKVEDLVPFNHNTKENLAGRNRRPKMFIYLIGDIRTEKLESALRACEAADDPEAVKAIGLELARRLLEKESACAPAETEMKEGIEK
jgi:transcriptional regulator with XRE-family HTH domain